MLMNSVSANPLIAIKLEIAREGGLHSKLEDNFTSELTELCGNLSSPYQIFKFRVDHITYHLNWGSSESERKTYV